MSLRIKQPDLLQGKDEDKDTCSNIIRNRVTDEE